MQRLAITLGMLAGWRRMGVAVAAGAASAFAMAPFHIWPVLLVTFPVLVWLLDGCYLGEDGAVRVGRSSCYAAARVGWAFGFGYFLAGLYWIGSAFLVEADIFAWLLPFAVTGMPAGLALFFSLAAILTGPIWRPGPPRLLALAVALTVTEWLRGQILTGFPWNALGYALTGSDAMMQSASVFGVYGLGLFAVLIFAAPAAVWGPGAPATRSGTRRLFYPALMAVLLAAAVVWGEWRLGSANVSFVQGASLRIVQPNIPQKEKWKPENRGAIFQRYLNVSRKGGADSAIQGVTHLIWPESALPFLLEETPEALLAVSAILPPGSVFITGAARAQREGDAPAARADPVMIFNSLLVMDHEARLLGHYDKTHLVPFGEYLPFQAALESIGLEQLTRVRGGFTPGVGTRLTMAPNLPPFVALICYEIIFPDAIREAGRKPEWMLNVTNDAWFGDGTGPYQHFHQARVRAVEQGLPLVRAANNGITAVTDAYGRIVARLPRNAAAALDSGLPRAAPGTVFVVWGNVIFLALLFVSLAVWWLLAIRH